VTRSADGCDSLTPRVESLSMPKTRAKARTPAYAKLGKYLASIRENAELSQAELAKRVGRTQSVIAQTETGRRRLDVIEFIALAKALGESPRRLFDRVLEELGNGK
jgi:DNA-binding XRE family transcriptional regulator